MVGQTRGPSRGAPSAGAGGMAPSTPHRIVYPPSNNYRPPQQLQLPSPNSTNLSPISRLPISQNNAISPSNPLPPQSPRTDNQQHFVCSLPAKVPTSEKIQIPPQQFIFKQVSPSFAMQQNFVVSVPVVGNGNYLAVTSAKPPGETNGTVGGGGTTFLTMTPRSASYLVAKNNENNNTATYIAMEPNNILMPVQQQPPATPPAPTSASPSPTVSAPTAVPLPPQVPHSHQYLIPKPEPFAMHNYSKNDPGVHVKFAATRPTNHQRLFSRDDIVSRDFKDMKDIKEEIKEENEEEGEEVRPVLDPTKPILQQIVQIDHCYGTRTAEKALTLDDDDKDSVISSDEKQEHGEEGEETETAAEGEDSITRCICQMEHDDGYMVSCDQCFVWQHVACVMPDTPLGSSLGDVSYLCEICQPRELDRARARALQIQRRKQIKQQLGSESSDDSFSSSDRPQPKKPFVRRRAEPVQRRVSKKNNTFHHSDNAYRINNTLNHNNRMNKISGRRRESSSTNATKHHLHQTNHQSPPPNSGMTSPTSTASSAQPLGSVSVGRRTKLKSKANLRRKLQNSLGSSRNINNKDNSENILISNVDDGKNNKSDIRNKSFLASPVKSRCRLSYTSSGEPMLVTTCRVACGEMVAEIHGKQLQAPHSTIKSECLFHYKHPKDGTNIIVDGSSRDNLARFARRSCNPNSHLKHCIVKGLLRLYLVTSETLEKNQQITIPHGSLTDNVSSSSKESCGKDCTFLTKSSSISTHNDKRKRRSRRTVSEEGDGRYSPPKRKEGKPLPVGGESNRTNESPQSPTHSDRKLTREEKKIEQAMKIFAQMEKETARKRDKDRPHPGGNHRRNADSDKESILDLGGKMKKRRKKRRPRRKSRLLSGGTSGGGGHSGEDSDVSSGEDEPSSVRSARESKDSSREEEETLTDAAGLLLALGGMPRRFAPQLPATAASALPCGVEIRGGVGPRTPPRAPPGESDSSPSTPLSSACLLVAAAVGPLAPGFKFPKTKKGMMNEWLGRSPDHGAAGEYSPCADVPPPLPSPEQHQPSQQSTSGLNSPPAFAMSNSRIYYPGSNSSFGKKRWLRQAISEETEPPLGSPPCPSDNGTPLKKRRLARESLTSEPPMTPPSQTPTRTGEELTFGENDSPEFVNPGDHDLPSESRVRSMQHGFLANLDYSTGNEANFVNYQTSPQLFPENLTLPRMGDIPEPGSGDAAVDVTDDASPVEPGEIIDDDDDGGRDHCDGEKKQQEKPEDIKESNLSIIKKLKKNDTVIVELQKTIKEELEGKSAVKSDSIDAVVPNLKQESELLNVTKVEVIAQSEMKPVDLVCPMETVPPLKRKLSVTEYLKRKKIHVNKRSDASTEEIKGLEAKCGPGPDSLKVSSPDSEDELVITRLPPLPPPIFDAKTLGTANRLRVEPTELERQRENLNERLRREFGLMISDDDQRPTSTVLRDMTASQLTKVGVIPVEETNGYHPHLPTPSLLPLPHLRLSGAVTSESLTQSAIYPEDSSNPPNPASPPPFLPSDRKVLNKFRN